MSKPMTRYPCDRKLYVGDLGNNASKQELEDAFSYYGPIRCCWVARNPPGFAFVEFEDVRDAEDAARGLDGRVVCGRRIRVEQSSGRGGRSRGPPRGRTSGSGRPFHPEDRCYECGERGHYARDCEEYKRGGGSSRKHNRSRSRSRDRRSRTRSRSRSRSRSRDRRSRDRRSRSFRSRSRSPADVRENGRNGI